MNALPAQQDLASALSTAATAHHDYELHFLGGDRDVHWSGWYAAYALGRLGDFATPTALARLLETSPADGDWAESAAAHVLEQLRAGPGAGSPH